MSLETTNPVILKTKTASKPQLQQTKPKRQRATQDTVAFAQKWQQSFEKNEPPVHPPFPLVRPPFTVRCLCALAMRNSKSGMVQAVHIYAFVLHHFIWYRYLSCDNWKNCIRNVLNSKTFEKCKVGKENTWYRLKNPDDILPDFFSDEEVKRYMQHIDPRGPAFFKRMIQGTVGLPRHLFYNIVGLGSPCFAGPENSALFYYLLSIGHVPKRFEGLFREYCHREHSGIEPWFYEEFRSFRPTLIQCPTSQKAFRKAVGPEEFIPKLTFAELSGFHDNVETYFKLQHKFCNLRDPTWETPRHSDVLEQVLNGPIQQVTYGVREDDQMVKGSLYDVQEPLPVNPAFVAPKKIVDPPKPFPANWGPLRYIDGMEEQGLELDSQRHPAKVSFPRVNGPFFAPVSQTPAPTISGRFYEDVSKSNGSQPDAQYQGGSLNPVSTTSGRFYEESGPLRPVQNIENLQEPTPGRFYEGAGPMMPRPMPQKRGATSQLPGEPKARRMVQEQPERDEDERTISGYLNDIENLENDLMVGGSEKFDLLRFIEEAEDDDDVFDEEEDDEEVQEVVVEDGTLTVPEPAKRTIAEICQDMEEIEKAEDLFNYFFK